MPLFPIILKLDPAASGPQADTFEKNANYIRSVLFPESFRHWAAALQADAFSNFHQSIRSILIF
jgi:hypothetical protein